MFIFQGGELAVEAKAVRGVDAAEHNGGNCDDQLIDELRLEEAADDGCAAFDHDGFEIVFLIESLQQAVEIDETVLANGEAQNGCTNGR